jgi:hypothetical protein
MEKEQCAEVPFLLWGSRTPLPLSPQSTKQEQPPARILLKQSAGVVSIFVFNFNSLFLFTSISNRVVFNKFGPSLSLKIRDTLGSGK